jgi:hypothetical protein
MQTFYSFTQFFNAVSLAHPNVTTFTIGDIYEIDLAKQTLFPLCHLIPNSVTIGDGIMTYNITLMVMDRVTDVTQDSSGEFNELLKNYKTVSNIHDVWNSTLLTLNDIISYVQRNAQAMEYEILLDSVCTPFQERFDNLLAGWQATININVGNPSDACVIQISDVQAAGGTPGC